MTVIAVPNPEFLHLEHLAPVSLAQLPGDPEGGALRSQRPSKSLVQKGEGVFQSPSGRLVRSLPARKRRFQSIFPRRPSRFPPRRWRSCSRGGFLAEVAQEGPELVYKAAQEARPPFATKQSSAHTTASFARLGRRSLSPARQASAPEPSKGSFDSARTVCKRGSALPATESRLPRSHDTGRPKLAPSSLPSARCNPQSWPRSWLEVRCIRRTRAKGGGVLGQGLVRMPPGV